MSDEQPTMSSETEKILSDRNKLFNRKMTIEKDILRLEGDYQRALASDGFTKEPKKGGKKRNRTEAAPTKKDSKKKTNAGDTPVDPKGSSSWACAGRPDLKQPCPADTADHSVKAGAATKIEGGKPITQCKACKKSFLKDKKQKKKVVEPVEEDDDEIHE